MNVIPNVVVFIILNSTLCVFSERDLTIKFDICYRPSVCRFLSVCNVRAPYSAG